MTALSKTSAPRRAARAVVVTAATTGLLLTATPALADVPVGWSEPDEVNTLDALVVIVGAPLLLALLITFLVLLPSLARGNKSAPGSQGRDEWFGGPRKGTAELATPDDAESQAGGARAGW
ncbi:hypothetical protein [Nocardioides pacificus]